MFGDVYQLILGAMILMILGTLSAFYIYYQELKAEQKETEEEMKKESAAMVDKLKAEMEAREAAKKSVNLATDMIPTEWMSDTLTNISGGRIFRITTPIFTYLDASNNGDAICSAFDSKAKLAGYSHLRYAYSRDASGVRGDASANWCEYSWGRGGKTAADGLAFKMADAAYANKNAATCGTDSSGIQVLNAYKWSPDAKMGIICYTPNAKVQSDSNSQPPVFSGSQLTATYENFTGAPITTEKSSFVGNVKKALNTMLTPILPDFAKSRDSFISYDEQFVPVLSDSAFKVTDDGKYSLF